MIKQIKTYLFERKVKTFFRILCEIIDGLRGEGMGTMQARDRIIKWIDELIIARAQNIAIKADKIYHDKKG